MFFTNQPKNVCSEDGLELESAYIISTVRCAPPKNRPLPEEVRNCSEYLKVEARLLDKIEVVPTFWRIALDTYDKYMLAESGGPKPGFRQWDFVISGARPH